ncbi:MAG: DNA-3-methyladenine glycosylase I [Phycisphaerales bacterium]
MPSKPPPLSSQLERTRCAWATSPAMIAYHDEEWGVPSRDEHHLYEMLTLEGAQAGLSWETILNKRAGYRRLFKDFDPARVARFTQADIERLMLDPAIVRNRLKVDSTVSNAKAVLKLHEAGATLGETVWSVVGGIRIVNRYDSPGDLPAQSAESMALSKLLKSRGFRFVGPTTMYAFMQAVGMVNDHAVDCFRHDQV